MSRSKWDARGGSIRARPKASAATGNPAGTCPTRWPWPTSSLGRSAERRAPLPAASSRESFVTSFHRPKNPVNRHVATSVARSSARVSRWYARKIRQGYRPHPRHWLALVSWLGCHQIVDECSRDLSTIDKPVQLSRVITRTDRLSNCVENTAVIFSRLAEEQFPSVETHTP